MTKKILLVDDEPQVLRLLQLSLEQAGYQVATAENGQQALEQVASDKPDLVLMDSVMPLMDGMEALKRLKSNVATAEIPVVMLTAKDCPDEMAKSWEVGTDLYLTKPILTSELLDFIQTILS
jgi:DNA-binding response OmpR family regulator